MNKNGNTMDTSTVENLENRFDGIKESVKGMVDKGQERAGEIKTRVIGVKDEAMTRGNAVFDGALEFVKANPMKAVGIAFGAGYFGMRLFRR